MNPSSSFRVQGELKYGSQQQSLTPEATIIKLLKIIAGDTNIASDFSQLWTIREFQLGDDLTSYTNNIIIENVSNIFYLVCRGRVRLLSFDATLGREVSTQLLLTEQTFGGDDLFYDCPLAYRAIAASQGFVAQITIADLQVWLQRLPNLENHLQKSALERQALIFLRSYTELRSLNSATVRQLLPYIVTKKIPAGSSLITATPATQGRFWLAGGTTTSLLLGDSWGYPDVTSPDAIAETDLLIYHLPREEWESAKALAPQILVSQDEQQEVVSSSETILSSPITQIPLPKPDYSQPEISAVSEIDFLQTINQPHPKAKSWRKYHFIPQQSSSDCGAACLAMISQFWGKRFSLNTLRNLADVDRTGASLAGLAAAAQALGYDVLQVRASLTKLELQDHPWIAHWQGTHYIVVWRVKGDRILIADPAMGQKWLSRPEFEASWTGYALLLNPTEHFHALASENISLSRYWQTLQPYRQLIQQIILVSLVVQVFGLAIPLLTQAVIDQVVPLKNFATLNAFALGFLCLGVWRIVLTAQRQYLLDYFANRIDTSLIGGFIKHTLQLPLQFFTSRRVEDILSRVQENRKIQEFLTRRAISSVIDAFMIVVYLGVMVYFNLKLTLLVLSGIVPVVILTLGASSFLKQVSREVLQTSARQNSTIVEMMTGIVTVKTAAAEIPVQTYWEERLMKMLKTRLRGQKLANVLQMLRNLISHVATTVVLWCGLQLVISGEMSLGKFVAFNMLISNVTNPVLALVGLWDELQAVLTAAERVNDVLDSQPEENSQKPLQVMPEIRGEVWFENVFFRYHPDDQRHTLQNVSFRVKPRQTIGIIGQSGSGKSTLVNLLAGLYRPSSGRILIDGLDIAAVSPSSLRSQIGFVPQDCFLFSGTILENITLYADFNHEQAIAAAKLAEAHGFIRELPLGYNTHVGERGLRLSGGQRQKIAIARALLTNPRILILDEATSGLDPESERCLYQKLIRLSQYRITFIISHRLSSVRHADHILVLDQGMLVEQGTHQRLMETTGLYSRLAKLQLQL
ncbi:ATP-binding cassette domain-containing protein [Fortiea sp. LEGE XX443]|uniref:ABC transporter transmembrane domain-containing protein n=1 Tax=Fortiea sp. LEGE XX443 TaxID=1828611 RepID=UPI001881EF0F|nr:ABC transporter transmembrane domain-containing protein [Fortiea sp. LEGE XX443]MBE9006220.1 ATP-binding cassette domain-containing protein [Fortiea sp. LEGE XX443]